MPKVVAACFRTDPPFRTLRRSRTFVSDLANFFRVLACQRSRDPAEAGDGGVHRSRDVRDAGGLHRSLEHLMLVMHRDGFHCDRHGRDAV